jgi:NAD(P)-dependent dehydrogenase (short-subunit alcohol dehydrogenase family)
MSVLEGRCAVVTGSSRGIGRAVALALAAEGAAVVVNGRPDVDGLATAAEAVAEEIRRGGGRALVSAGSVADFDYAGELIAASEEAFGPIDVLVNCAGIAEPEGASILLARPEDWTAVLDVHLGGTFNCCRQAAPRMARRGSGCIVNTSSHAFTGLYGGTSYAAAKGAINSLTYALAAELREHGVRVNAVCPGARTRLSTGPVYERHIRSLNERGLLPDAVRDAALDPPEPRFVGPIYAFLASDRGAGITGRIFSTSGGFLGLFAAPDESLIAYRDHATHEPWTQAELGAALLDSGKL